MMSQNSLPPLYSQWMEANVQKLVNRIFDELVKSRHSGENRSPEPS